MKTKTILATFRLKLMFFMQSALSDKIDNGAKVGVSAETVQYLDVSKPLWTKTAIRITTDARDYSFLYYLGNINYLVKQNSYIYGAILLTFSMYGKSINR